MKRFPKVISACSLLVIMLTLFEFQASQACYSGKLQEDLNNDGKVDVQDIIIVARAYGSFPGHQSWDPTADIVLDEEVNIFDVVSVAIKFGLSQCPSEINSSIQITPRTLNIKSNGRWITGKLKLPNTIDIQNINVSSIMLNETIPVELMPTFTEEENESEFDLVIKFGRQKVIEMISKNCLPNKFATVILTVTGKLTNGTSFRGSDTIKILNCP